MNNGDITIDMLLSKEEQTRIGINNDDVDHVRPIDQKLSRILAEYNKLQAELAKTEEENRRLIEQNEGYGELLGSANHDVEQLTKYADDLEAKNKDLQENMTHHAINYRRDKLKQLEAENKQYKDALETIKRNAKAGAVTINWVRDYARQALQGGQNE